MGGATRVMEAVDDMAGGRTLSLRQRIRMEREQEKIVETEIEMERKRIERMKASLQMLAWEREHTQASVRERDMRASCAPRNGPLGRASARWRPVRRAPCLVPSRRRFAAPPAPPRCKS